MHSAPDTENILDDADQEIAAMTEASKILKPLSPEVRRRVLDWAYARFLAGEGAPSGNARVQKPAAVSEQASSIKFEHFVDLFDAIEPNTAADKALVAAYWFKVYGGQETFTSQPINSALKDLGHGISHMPSAFSALEQQQPALVRQMQKSGKSQQARKTYKITDAGIKAVESMIKTSTYTE